MFDFSRHFLLVLLVWFFGFFFPLFFLKATASSACPIRNHGGKCCDETRLSQWGPWGKLTNYMEKCHGRGDIQLHLSSCNFEKWTCTCCIEQKELRDTGKNINNLIQWVFYVSEHTLRRNSCMFWIMYSSEIVRNSKNYLWSACEDNSGSSTKLKMSFCPLYLTSLTGTLYHKSAPQKLFYICNRETKALQGRGCFSYLSGLNQSRTQGTF